MKFAYADPPYLGMGAKMYGKLHPDAADFDKIETHAALIDRLSADFDAWALSMGSKNLRDLLPLCPADVRVGAWVKPFCSFKIGVRQAYAWEPVIFRGGRAKAKWEFGGDERNRTVRDFISASMALRKGFQGAKPDAFSWWIFDFIGAEADDEFHDLFPGSGAVSRAWEEWKRAATELPLFGRAIEAPGSV